MEPETAATAQPQQQPHLRDLGEFALIARLTQGLEVRPDVALGIGDDAALLDIGGGMLLAATCDAQVEGQHFVRGVASAAEIGHKALAVNLSDIAAMGAEPLWALVSLLAPPSLEVALLDGIYAGMRALARQHAVAIVGGNVAATSGPLTLDVTLLGRVAVDRALRRSGARPGDRIVVTGTLGLAAAGLLTLLPPAQHADLATHLAPPHLASARAAQTAPTPRVAAGQALAAAGIVSAMLDISDGLAADLGHLCAASAVGATLDADALPIDDATRAVAAALQRDPLALALHGGEDYELLFTVGPQAIAQALAVVASTGGSATVIGTVTAATDGMRLRAADGSLRLLVPQGWDHLR